ncbi:MAG: hypothetical protein OEW88_11690 [Gammaproteobacteria bacterium]|nr:hypothetical protein [Gammaproteobacteria bacterium]MDH5277076.1 hypothetical protein [Gammaproteobacteria bacterium]
MRSNRATWRRLIPAAILSAAAGLVAWADGPDQAPANPPHFEEGHPTGHVHDHANQTWPPQPRGISNAVTLSSPGVAERIAEQSQRQKAERERIAMAQPGVRKALGRRYTSPYLVEPDVKDVAGAGTAQLVYFSHERNATVEVTLDNKRVLGVREIAATDYQPDVTDDEITEAEGIARAYFSDRGKVRVAALRAYGILAYPPQGKSFYPVRVIYVSFHEADDAPPEFSAWVDLSNRRVLRSREEQS